MDESRKKKFYPKCERCSIKPVCALSGMVWSLLCWWNWRRRSSWRRLCSWQRSRLRPSKPSVCAANMAASTRPGWVLANSSNIYKKMCIVAVLNTEREKLFSSCLSLGEAENELLTASVAELQLITPASHRWSMCDPVEGEPMLLLLHQRPTGYNSATADHVTLCRCRVIRCQTDTCRHIARSAHSDQLGVCLPLWICKSLYQLRWEDLSHERTDSNAVSVGCVYSPVGRNEPLTLSVLGELITGGDSCTKNNKTHWSRKQFGLKEATNFFSCTNCLCCCQ